MGARVSKWLGLDVLDCADLDPFSGTLPQTLPSLDVQGIASFIRDARKPNIVVLAGAGISTAAGIPDFRSPSEGLYATLASRFSHKPASSTTGGGLRHAAEMREADTTFSRELFDQDPRPLYLSLIHI